MSSHFCGVNSLRPGRNLMTVLIVLLVYVIAKGKREDEKPFVKIKGLASGSLSETSGSQSRKGKSAELI